MKVFTLQKWCPKMLRVCLCVYFPCNLIFKAKQITDSFQSISPTAVRFCQPQRKHFSLRLILHKPPWVPRSLLPEVISPPTSGRITHTHKNTHARSRSMPPPRDRDDLPVDVKSNQSKSCCSEGLPPGGWRSNHLIPHNRPQRKH